MNKNNKQKNTKSETNDPEIDQEDGIESLGLTAINYKSITDRYFEKYYLNKDTEDEQYIFVHSNGIIMCGLGANHKVVKSPLKITKIRDLNKCIKVQGKKKHGAHYLKEGEKIIDIIMEDGSVYKFKPKLNGKLLEINAKLIQKVEEINPIISDVNNYQSKFYDINNLIKKYSEKHGFICLCMLNSDALVNFEKKLKENEENNAIVV